MEGIDLKTIRIAGPQGELGVNLQGESAFDSGQTILYSSPIGLATFRRYWTSCPRSVGVWSRRISPTVWA